MKCLKLLLYLVPIVFVVNSHGMQFQSVNPVGLSSAVNASFVKYFLGDRVGEENEATVRSACTGSFISKRTILTAAHCLLDGDGKPIVSDLILSLYQSKTMGEAIFIRQDQFRVFTHPDYDKTSSVSDIALIVLEGDFYEGAVVKIDPEVTRMISSKKDIFVFGGGSRNFNVLVKDRYKRNFDYILNGKILGAPVFRLAPNSKGFFSALTPIGVKVCKGDSGGPMVVFKNGQVHQVGVLSKATINFTTAISLGKRTTLCSRSFEATAIDHLNVQWIINHFE